MYQRGTPVETHKSWTTWKTKITDRAGKMGLTAQIESEQFQSKEPKPKFLLIPQFDAQKFSTSRLPPTARNYL